VWLKNKRTANLRELTRIAFSLRRRALLRLIAYAGIARRLEKCWGQTRVRVFLFVYYSFSDFGVCGFFVHWIYEKMDARCIITDYFYYIISLSQSS
jgi:hypothetical protein